MSNAAQDARGQGIHQKWLGRRAYGETFGEPGSAFPKWQGKANRCKCGCGEVWYDRVSPINWWEYFVPSVLVNVQFLVPLFLALHNVIWHLPPVIWIWFRMATTAYKQEVRVRCHSSEETAIALTVAKVLLYGIVAPPTLVACTAILVLTRSRVLGIVVLALWLASLLLLITMILVLMVTATIAISMRGLAFILGGLVSVVYVDYPLIGIVLIVIGVFLQYESGRQNERLLEERVGTVILRLTQLEGQSNDWKPIDRP